MNRFLGLAIACGMALGLPACGKKNVKKETPVTVEMAAEKPAPAKAALSSVKKSYVVKKGESLWTIAAREDVLGDPFRWPLLFKANRDQIADPDLIEVKQDLQFKKNYDNEELNDAVDKAKETPAYVPHSAPRKSLPVKY